MYHASLVFPATDLSGHVHLEVIRQYDGLRVAQPCPRHGLLYKQLQLLTKLSTLRYKLPFLLSRLSLPHSQLNTQPLGALLGIGGIGFRMSGRR